MMTSHDILTRDLPAEKLAYTVAEAASSVGLGETSIRSLIKDGDLPSFKWCGRRLIRKADLQAAIDAQVMPRGRGAG